MSSSRILSIDIFRGLTIFLMVFVNELAGVSAIPAWMKHVPPGVDGMTFVDVVFPGIYWLVDLKNVKSRAAFLKPAGENPLLTYILPALFYAIIGYAFIPDLLTRGFTGILYALVFSLFILWLARWLTRMGIRLHL